MARDAKRNYTDDPIGAHMRRRVLSGALPEEPWRMRNVPVDGERTVGQARALRGRIRRRAVEGPTLLQRQQSDPTTLRATDTPLQPVGYLLIAV